ncbi:MAG TPA: Z1 domain-containing protein [Mucilaginibacter sp.]|nr:Z1 domain-containing protein [Mucilaginibacter sp.]
MDSNSYQALKDFITSKLRKVEGPLPKDKILEEIEDANTLIGVLGTAKTAKLLTIESFELPEEDDWNRMIRELETHFDVKMDRGILIQGDEQKERDTSWWTSVYKQRSKKYYWNRFRSYLEGSLSPEVIKTLDIDTDIVMNNLENPAFGSFSRYGMVVGHVQSGKTGNYSALVCKAADAGYKFIVVISGDKNNLRNQTQERLNESFIGQTKGVQVGAGKGNSSKELLPYSLTTIERDFNKQDADKLAQGLNFDNVSVPILLVIKKNTNTLNNVIDWLQKQYVNKVTNHAMLVIDDESDYASINTKEDEDPTAINKKLRTLISLFNKSAYVAYTATPYANIFIDHQAETADFGRDLFPKDFIYALYAPTNYFGARRVFIDSDNAHLVPINDWFDDLPSNHKKDFKVAKLPQSLLEAIRLFLLVIAVRNLRGQGDKHNSMLVHATRFTDVHKLLGRLAEDYLGQIKNDVSVYGKLKNAIEQSALLNDMKETFESHYPSLEFKWDKVIRRLADIVDNVVVREVHQSTSVPLEYRKDVPTNAIVIGGTSLSRGFTLEGLSVSYFLRNTVFYDTLMQMGRWFGYRAGYEDLCRIYMPADRIADFAEIIRATEELFQDFKIMADNNMTPNDFGLAVQQNPDSLLQVTARNKQKNVHEFIHSMKLDGKLKETSYLRRNERDISENLETLKDLLNKLGKESETIAGTYVWRKVSKEKIIPFFRGYKTFDNDRLGLTSRMPIAFIEQFAMDRDTLWDVALFSGEGDPFVHGHLTIAKEKRMFNIEETFIELQNRQVSSGSAEAVGLEDARLRKNLSNNRGETRRNLSRPLLMLHILQQSFGKNGNPDEQKNPIKEIAAFGVSFPGSVATRSDTITLKINTVYYQNLLKQLAEEEDTDD